MSINNEQKIVLESVKALSSTLPVDGKVALLEHLLGELGSADLQKLPAEARASLLQTLPEAQTSGSDLSALSCPAIGLTTEQKLRAENRIQDDPEILAKLGFKGTLPPIPAELIEECARTSGTVVLRFKTTILDYQAKLNEAIGSDKDLHLENIVCSRDTPESAKALEIKNEEPTWINVPNTINPGTMCLPKAVALTAVPGSRTCDAMEFVLMLGYHHLKTGQHMPGFKNNSTFTNQKNTSVGYLLGGISVYIGGLDDVAGNGYLGLAPRLPPESKKS